MTHTGTSQTWPRIQMPWDLVKVQMLIQGWAWFCISNKIPGDADAAGLWTTL